MKKNVVMNRYIVRLAGVALVLLGAAAHATTDWSSAEYDLYPGDFDGDGKTDLLYVAKDQAKASGIARSDGTAPNIAFQSWPSNYLGIPWYGNTYVVIVGDFNGDSKSDLFLQRRTPGDSFLLLADANGKITAISQTVSSTYQGLEWTGDKHKIIAGDFNGDGKSDLFLQATSSTGTHAFFAANASGQFTAAAAQTWTDATWTAFKWSTQNSILYAGDFNGDGRDDLLVQARPKIVMVDYDVPIPVPTYPPNSNGVALAQSGSTPFLQVGVQQWSRTANGVDWSPLGSNVVIGDFNGDGRDDVVLQSRVTGRSSYLIPGNASGTVFTSSTALASNVTWSGDSFRLIAGNFDGTGGAGMYFQAPTASGTNYYANTITGASVTVTAHDPTSATGVVVASAVGHTVGSFAVSATGAATYSIPIVAPPGVAGVQPTLAIAYASGGGNGMLGIGWSLSGFSEIERCSKTLAQDNSTDAVALTTAASFCLDGNKLRLTGGAYGAPSSTYETEMQTFARVTANGTAGNGPASFVVEAKNGLTYEYGNSADSRIEAVNSGSPSTVLTWVLNKVSDAHGNTMTITYQEDGAPNGSFRPLEIAYTSNGNASLAAAYKVAFVWEPRSAADTLVAYRAGSLVKEVNRLNRIETKYNDPVGGWRLVRKYQLSYNTSGSTPRTRLGAVQECDRNGSCLSPTMISWQDGGRNWSATDVTSSSNSAALMEYSYPLDIDGDGREDLVYPEVVSGATRWLFMKANASGGFDPPVNTGVAAGDSTNLQYAKAQPIDYYSEGRLGLLVDVPGYSTRQILRWNGSTLTLTNTDLTAALTGKEWVADFDGDGRLDFLYATATATVGSIYVQKNSGSTGSTAQFQAAQQVYSTALNGSAANPFAGEYANWMSRLMDFNGDGRVDFLYSLVRTDSCTGVCVYTTTWTALLSNGTSFAASTSWSRTWVMGNSFVPLVGDFNGDGLTDVITDIDLSQSPPPARIAYGNGAGVTAPVSLTLPALFNTSGFTADYDSDGRADLLYAPNPTSGTWYVVRSNGSGFDPPVAIPLNSTSANNTVRVLDHNGDGLRDLGYKNAQYRVRKHNGSVPDYVSSITDGFGNTVTVQYAPLTDSAVYTKGTGATFPQIDLQGPMYVVSRYDVTDDVGGTFAITEKFTGLRLHAQGRGLLGFATRETNDGRSGIKTVATFRQDYPYVGMVSQATTYQSSTGPIITQLTNTLTELPIQGGSYNERRFPYISQSVQNSYEVGGPSNTLPIAGVTIATVLDSYGNPTSVTKTTSDLTGSSQWFQSVTTNTYDTADANCWRRGFVTLQTVANSTSALSPQTRTIQFVKDTSNLQACRVDQQIVEPNDNSVKVTTTLGYDSFGHPSTQVISAINVANRTMTVNYGTRGVFPMSITQSVSATFNQGVSRTYDFALGVAKTATDPNGIVTGFDYDGFGRLIRENRPDGTKTELVYAACGIGNGYCGDSRLRYQVEKRELDTSSAMIRSSRQLFDGVGRSLYSQSQTLSGALSNVATNYDNQGRAFQRSQPYFTGFPVYYTTVSYDLIGRPTQEQRRISEADSGTQTVTYGYDRLVHTFSDPNNKTTTKQFNAIGQIVKMTDAASGITQYEYDQFGNRTRTLDPASNQIVNTFNIRGFKLTTNDPDMGNWIYTYYPTGELWTQQDAKSQTVTFTYDHLSRPLTHAETEGTTSFTYGTSATAHNIGRLESVSAPSAYSESFTYDALGRVQDATTNADATSFVVSHTYNANNGLLETVTYPTSTSAVPGSRLKVQYEYAYGLLKRTRDFNSPSTIYWEQIATNAGS